MKFPLCYRCNKWPGIRYKYVAGPDSDMHVKLCTSCKNKLFTPEGFIQFGTTLQDIQRIAKPGLGIN